MGSFVLIFLFGVSPLQSSFTYSSEFLINSYTLNEQNPLPGNIQMNLGISKISMSEYELRVEKQ